jgi:hypothetical protein
MASATASKTRNDSHFSGHAGIISLFEAENGKLKVEFGTSTLKNTIILVN